MEKKAIYIFVFRLYWLDQSMIKSSTTNGSDIKSHITTSGARLAFVYKVIIFINKSYISFPRYKHIFKITL